jgi:hypothetical protein
VSCGAPLLALTWDRWVEISIGAAAAIGAMGAAAFAAWAASQSKRAADFAAEVTRLEQEATLNAQIVDGLVRCDAVLAEIEVVAQALGTTVTEERWQRLRLDLRAAYAIAATDVPMVSNIVAWDVIGAEERKALPTATSEGRRQVHEMLALYQRKRLNAIATLGGTHAPDRGHAYLETREGRAE